MALLDEAFQPFIQHQNESEKNKVKKELSDTVVGYAYGPRYANGLAAYGCYDVERDPETTQLFINNEKGKEYIHEDGKVIGREEDKSYIMRMK